ncbi:precorrin-3B C(17)-methyltransferase [uncultured Bartonella sp.]|uniref:precorrin-3B C(17)-methyltransferase n=1 Tax=uncultured Bartonella sp. TaxID=104108 RepID=UPI00262F1C1A|nr:precorrin-3B C(17)-methyltransferase [uncultured Bartonella sp.]
MLFKNVSQHLAIFLFSDYPVAKAIALADRCDSATIYATDHVANNCCTIVDSISNTMIEAFKAGRPIVAFCACGIVVRILAPYLNDKFCDPPVLCIAEDGSSVVPLLGGASGANELACQFAEIVNGQAAITTSGWLRFGINLVAPPSDLELVNKKDAAAFISSLLAGEKIQLIGRHDWILSSALPLAKNAPLKIVIGNEKDGGSPTTLVYRQKPENQGCLTIIGLGSGDRQNLTFSARKALDEATDIFAYDYYIKLASPFLPNQTLHASDNRQELQRAKDALNLAAKGNKVAIISSGDPGIFAMASAVFECMDKDLSKLWSDVDVKVEPGITAAQSAAARLGAPLGHDFAIISLSDNLKPWSIIEKRIVASIQSDMVLALYNPVSHSRPTKIIDALAIMHRLCTPERIVMIGTDVGRQGEKIITTTLAELAVADITSRSVVLIGSSQTRTFRQAKKLWSYTPRSYSANPNS